MAVAIMISTFGCNNGLILAGARAYYAMARDGLFFKPAGRLNAAKVPAWGLLLQGIWAAFLVLPRTFDPQTGKYGNLYSNLLDYVISAALIFYALTIAGIFRLRQHAARRRAPLQGVGLPGGAGPLHPRRGDAPRRALRLPHLDHLARADHRAARRAGVLRLEKKGVGDGEGPCAPRCTREQPMTFLTDYLYFNTTHRREMIRITDEVTEIVQRSGVREGMVLVSAMHITAASM